MDKIIRSEIEKVVSVELVLANTNYPQFSSGHEAYAVIKEEAEEATEDIRYVQAGVDDIWHKTKENCCCLSAYEQLKRDAVSLAAEAVQVAAMAQKAIDSMKE